ncbi:MAG: DEAD/DEAH box helicase [Gemmiger sp.]|nr:DEAD/DEAH box helicase [Gemmiger sp.]
MQTLQTQTPITNFSALNLSPELARAVALMGFETATPIQAQAIPVIASGADLVARSQTGTGKTVAFGLPAIQAVDGSEDKSTVQVLILCPTRELALQGGEEIRKLARFMPQINPVEIYGGAPIDKQCIRLRRANMVIGTPGRIMDHMRRKSLKLSNLKMIVLDEADEMLNMGFKEDIETILKGIPAQHQTVLFSATMPPPIMALTKQFQTDPQMIEIDKEHVTLDNIQQSYIDVPHSSKKNALDLLMQYCHPQCAIVFCNTKIMADELATHMEETGIHAEALHGDLRQAQRTAVMQSFKAGRTQVLVATDIAARGIDVSNVEYVINFDLPQNTEYYIHRIGRTGRAGKAGKTITICGSRREVIAIRGIASAVKSEINEFKVPTVGEIQKQCTSQLGTVLEEALQTRPDAACLALVDKLETLGYTPQAIAAAAIGLTAAKTAPEIAHLVDVPAAKFGGNRPRNARPRPARTGPARTGQPTAKYPSKRRAG